MIECNRSDILARCNCSYEPCSRKGKCCECVEYHRIRNELPACYFNPQDEATYDRSLQRFISSRE